MSGMKILFVYPEIGIANIGSQMLHLGLASLSAYAKQHGHSTGVLCVTTNDRDELISRIRRFKPDIVGISSGTQQWSFAKQFGQWIKEATGLPIIYGGWHPTLVPEDAIALPFADYVCIGEGEVPLTELLDRMQKGLPTDTVQGLWVRRDGAIIRNSGRPLVEDLDALPFMDLDVFNFRRVNYNLDTLEGFNHTLQIAAGRGCPFSCTFCCAKAFRDIYKAANSGRYVRVRSPRRTVEEVAYHYRKYPFVDSVAFADDMFLYSAKWLAEFVPLYVSQVNLPFFTSARVDIINEEILKLLKAANCSTLLYGVETGNEELRNKICKKGVTNEQIRRAFRLTREYGIRSVATFIVGLPYETLDNFNETKQLAVELEADAYEVHQFCPFPGSEAMETCLQNGWVRKDVPLSYLNGAGIEMPWLTSAQIRQCGIELMGAIINMMAKKRQKGYYDFAANLDDAVKESLPEIPIRIGSVFVNCFEPVWLLVHPPASITYKDVKIREKSDLVFAIGVSETVYSMPGGGVEFIVTVNGTKVFSKKLDPKRKKGDRGWSMHRVSLDKYAVKPAEVSFITKAFGKGGNQYCSSGWGRPFLTQR
jgi:radical SAM superfamily enzyme YgiQ (UPF0313 family)